MMFYDFLRKFKRELLYGTLIFVIWEVSLLPEILGVRWLFWILALLGGLVLVTWILTNYYLLAHRLVSKYSDVLLKINLRQRFFAYFFTPILFYCGVTMYLYGVQNILLKQSVLLLSVLALFFLFINIRASYDNAFKVEQESRFSFLLIDIILYYIGVTGFVLLGTTPMMRVAGAVLIGGLLLAHQLILNKQLSARAFAVLLLSSGLLLGVALILVNFAPLAFPLHMSVIFYVILAIWGIRLSGVYQNSDYLPPVLFGLMAYMVLLSFQ